MFLQDLVPIRLGDVKIFQSGLKQEIKRAIHKAVLLQQLIMVYIHVHIK